MSNDTLNLINQIATKYKLTQEEINVIIEKFKEDKRDINTLSKEIDIMANYFAYQNYFNSKIASTNPLEPGKSHYVLAFGSNSEPFLQPVSISLLNRETNEVMVENTFKGYQKHDNVDDLEIAICQTGMLLGFDIVEEYRLYNANKQKDSVIIKDLVNGNEFYDVENLKRRFLKLISNGKLRKEKWVDDTANLTVANTKDDYRLVVEYGLNILRSLPSILESDYNTIEEKYFDMLIFDSIISQSERNFKDYGIICNKETKRYTYAPLFDNVYPTILKNNDIIVLNGITCNRYELIEFLFYNCYDKIKDRVKKLLDNKTKYLQNIDIILKYNLDLSHYNMLMNNIVANFNYFERLNNEITIINQNKNNAGFINVLQMAIGLVIICIFSFLIGYLLFRMQ